MTSNRLVLGRIARAMGALLLGGALTLVGCAHDPLDTPGDNRTLSDFGTAFPEIDTTPLEAPADEGELHVVEYGGGWNLSAQPGAASSLVDWLSESRDLTNMRHGWSRYEGTDREIWLKLTAGGKITTVSVRTSLP